MLNDFPKNHGLSTGFSEDKVGGKTSGNLAPDDYMKPKRPENENGKKELKRGTKACVICGITAGMDSYTVS